MMLAVGAAFIKHCVSRHLPNILYGNSAVSPTVIPLGDSWEN